MMAVLHPQLAGSTCSTAGLILTPPASSASSFFLLKLLMPMLRTRPLSTRPSSAAHVAAVLGLSSGPEQPVTTGQ
jgi:hypothetical protein